MNALSPMIALSPGEKEIVIHILTAITDGMRAYADFLEQAGAETISVHEAFRDYATEIDGIGCSIKTSSPH